VDVWPVGGSRCAAFFALRSKVRKGQEGARKQLGERKKLAN